jgi:hypothetical protein
MLRRAYTGIQDLRLRSLRFEHTVLFQQITFSERYWGLPCEPKSTRSIIVDGDVLEICHN